MQNEAQKHPFGYFNKVVSIDVETSGINRDSFNPADGYQIVSIGLVLADAKTFKEIDSKYIEIKWNGTSKWSEKAQAVHGLSKEYLEENGIAEEEAVVEICEFLLKYYNVEDSITLLGHNVTFDYGFLFNLLKKYEIHFKFSHRRLDTFSISMATVQQFNSDDLFKVMGFDRDIKHNALGDARMALKVYENISKIWQTVVMGE